MPFSSENLLKELDQNEIINWALELKYREEAYGFLRRALQRGELNGNQMRNALHALFQVGYNVHGPETLETLVGLSAHTNEAIRSEAVQLAIGLVRWSSKHQTRVLILTSEQKTRLRESVRQGVNRKVTKLANDFLGQ